MDLEFRVGSGADRWMQRELRFSYAFNMHGLNFRAKSEDGVLVGALMMDPDLSLFNTMFKPEPRIKRVEALSDKAGISYDDVVAGIVSAVAGEILDRADGFFNSLQKAFADEMFSGSDRYAMRGLQQRMSRSHRLLSEFIDHVSRIALKGENVVDYFLNYQGKMFPLSFYNSVVNGIYLHENLGFWCPEGVLKGILLRRGFVPYSTKDESAMCYLSPSCPVPDTLQVAKPFSNGKPL